MNALCANKHVIIIIIIFTLGINDPEGFWKKISEIQNVGVTITPGSPRG